MLRNKATQWRLRARDGPHAKPPSLRDTMVFICTHGNSATQAAAIPMALGYQRVMAIDGGLTAATSLAPPSSSTASSLHNGRVIRESSVGQNGSGNRDVTGRRGAARIRPSRLRTRRERHPRLRCRSCPGARRNPAMLLLMEHGQAHGAPMVTLVDTRRHDERAVYGSIRRSVHLAERLSRRNDCGGSPTPPACGPRSQSG